MKFTAVIPDRYAAYRFPRKLIQLLNGKTLIVHTYEHTVAPGLFDELIVDNRNDKPSMNLQRHLPFDLRILTISSSFK